jgi:hypothetical protein
MTMGQDRSLVFRSSLRFYVMAVMMALYCSAS